ncbi:MAG: carboxypeptidase regulatory-like domain-containing protein [Chloracidobacterium sp.]|nr:carboxypeptidase regulatory-like domain-containing protein [Chloracidobacterium sp.]
MRKLSFALSIIILPSAFHSVQAQAAEAKTGTATISGRVTLKGEPARGALVVLRSEEAVRSTDRSPGFRIKTDENGRFWFANLKAGRYTLSAFAPGFITPVENTAINLSDGEDVENQEISLKRGGVITGRVTGPNGKLLVEQLVNLTRLDERGQPIHTRNFSQYSGLTDDRGIYRIYGLPAGRYLVSAGFAQREGLIMMTADRSYYQLTYHPNTIEESKAKAVEVSEGFEATDIDIKIAEAKKKYDVFGRVVDEETGQPVPGVMMFIGSLTDGGKRIDTYRQADAQTDAKGEFQIQGLFPGKYATFGSAGQESDYYYQPAVFEISEEDVTGLVVKMSHGGSISGVAVIEGTNDPAVLSKLSQIRISAHVKSEESLAQSGSTANISSGGAFTLKRLKAGVAVFSISSGQEPENFFILRVEQNGAPQRAGVQINPGEQMTGVRIAIGYGTNVVRGQLRLTGGALPEGALLSVYAYRAGTEIVNGRSGRVDPVGRFVIEGLTPGEYELRPMIFFPFGSTQESAKLTERLGGQTQTVTVSGSQETQVTLVVDLTPREGR